MRSDVDIVVDGIGGDEYFELFRFLENRINSRMDLILLGDIAEKDGGVLDKRVVIYEKNFCLRQNKHSRIRWTFI